jgi:hypothetical protein
MRCQGLARELFPSYRRSVRGTQSVVINNLCKKFKTCWIGLTKQGASTGKYQFVDGSSTKYIMTDPLSQWFTGDPTGECVEEVTDEYQLWARSQPAKCTKVQAFVCADPLVKSHSNAAASSSSSSPSVPTFALAVGAASICAVAMAGFANGVKVWRRRQDPNDFQPLAP